VELWLAFAPQKLHNGFGHLISAEILSSGYGKSLTTTQIFATSNPTLAKLKDEQLAWMAKHEDDAIPLKWRGIADKAMKQGRTDPTVHKLSRFRLSPTLSADEVVATIGLPAAYEGSGYTGYVYNLENNEQLWLWFVPEGSFTHLLMAVVYGKDGGHDAERRIFSTVNPFLTP
jgi:hypothetical protein